MIGWTQVQPSVYSYLYEMPLFKKGLILSHNIVFKTFLITLRGNTISMSKLCVPELNEKYVHFPMYSAF